jgi:hypothetical protein
MDGCSGSENDLILPAEEETEGYGILGERGVSRVSKTKYQREQGMWGW